MTKIEIYKQAINDVIFALSSLHGYDKIGHFYDKSIKDTLIELRESASDRIDNEECNQKTLKEFKDQFEKLFLEMKEQVGVVSLEMKECEEYRNGWSPLIKEKVIKFNINIENS